ncbi:MAG: 4-hydroxythreonine-4-phosphate dehydrogenase PdxA [Alphaproteobacteria bacterium]
MTVTRPIAVSMGEPAGIGPEIILKAWAARRTENVPPFIVFGIPHLFERLAKAAGVPIALVPSSKEAALRFDEGLPVFSGMGYRGEIAPGTPSAATAPCVLLSLERALTSVREGSARAMVTAPIQKAVLVGAHFPYPGHTEYLAAKCATGGGAAPEPLMLLVGGGLRVALVTVHTPLKDVAAQLSPAAIVRKGEILARGLETDFGIAAPRIAVAALNPHAGEAGMLGREEIEIITPAVARLTERGIAAKGPFPSDTLFHAGARANYDAVLCMYHDQALIPLKTLDFTTGVNVTLGLPVVRTSPDHGTALDIAGKNVADASSLIAALKLAGEIAERRERAAAR